MQRVVVLGLRLQRSWLTRNHSASLELTSRLLKSVSTACAQNRYRLRWREAVRDPSTSFALLTSLRMTVSADRGGKSATHFYDQLLTQDTIIGFVSEPVYNFRCDELRPSLFRQQRHAIALARRAIERRQGTAVQLGQDTRGS